jgi:plastocyanin
MKSSLTRRSLVVNGAAATACALTTTIGPARAQSANQIILLGTEIRPDVLNMSPNNSVFFDNQSTDMTHRIVADDGSFDTGDLVPGQLSESFLIETSGNISYHCEMHPGMTGLISVTD